MSDAVLPMGPSPWPLGPVGTPDTMGISTKGTLYTYIHPTFRLDSCSYSMTQAISVKKRWSNQSLPEPIIVITGRPPESWKRTLSKKYNRVANKIIAFFARLFIFSPAVHVKADIDARCKLDWDIPPQCIILLLTCVRGSLHHTLK